MAKFLVKKSDQKGEGGSNPAYGAAGISKFNATLNSSWEIVPAEQLESRAFTKSANVHKSNQTKYI